MIETKLVMMLRANQDSAIAALQRNDMAALEALALHEALIVDNLSALWRQRRLEDTAS